VEFGQISLTGFNCHFCGEKGLDALRGKQKAGRLPFEMQAWP
jgi:hypothetical protein